MSRGNLLIISVLVIALAGMFFWTLNLEQRLTTGSVESVEPNGDGRFVQRIETLESKFDGLEEVSRGNQIELSEMQGKMTALSASDVEQSQLLASLSSGGAKLPEGAVANLSVKDTVERVLAERAEKERKERTERMVRGWGRYLLADIEVSDEQRDNFVAVVSAYYDSRRSVYEKFRDGGDGSNETRDAEVKLLETDRNEKLMGIFGAADFQKIEERFKNSQQRMSGRGGNRGGGARTGGRNR